MATVQIYDLAARVHEPEGQRLEVCAATDDVVLLVLRQVQGLPANAQGLRVHLLTDRVLASRDWHLAHRLQLYVYSPL